MTFIVFMGLYPLGFMYVFPLRWPSCPLTCPWITASPMMQWAKRLCPQEKFTTDNNNALEGGK